MAAITTRVMPLPTLIHVTAQYSNAVLVAVLPHVSDVASKLDLPILQPVTSAHVAHCTISPYPENVGGGFWLTNGYWFAYSFGTVDSFRSPDNWFTIQELEGANRFVGKDSMTTNEAVEFARKSFSKLGYKEDFLNGNPSRVEGSLDVPQLGHIPFCRIVWENSGNYSVRFDVNLNKKQIVGMALSGTNFFRPNLQVGVKPELQSDYLKRIKGDLIMGTNPPPRLAPVK